MEFLSDVALWGFSPMGLRRFSEELCRCQTVCNSNPDNRQMEQSNAQCWWKGELFLTWQTSFWRRVVKAESNKMTPKANPSQQQWASLLLFTLTDWAQGGRAWVIWEKSRIPGSCQFQAVPKQYQTKSKSSSKFFVSLEIIGRVH